MNRESLTFLGKQSAQDNLLFLRQIWIFDLSFVGHGAVDNKYVEINTKKNIFITSWENSLLIQISKFCSSELRMEDSVSTVMLLCVC